MKIACLSDLHGHIPDEMPECDIVVVAGDICPDNLMTLKERHLAGKIQREWFFDVFMAWARSLDIPVVGIWGNHDFMGEAIAASTSSGGFSDLGDGKSPHVHFLHDSAVTVRGLKFYGTPWIRMNGRWAFSLTNPATLADRFHEIPHDTQVLLTHSPIAKMGDGWPKLVNWEMNVQVPAGSEELLKVVKQLPDLKLHVFGHIHEGRGHWPIADNYGHTTHHVNAAFVDEYYKPYPLPIPVIEIDA